VRQGLSSGDKAYGVDVTRFNIRFGDVVTYAGWNDMLVRSLNLREVLD
jgi:hypothetical protein